jgi:hypothetical protein
MAERLMGLGFEKDPEKEFWTNERDLQGPTQTIIINNQRKDMPGETHHVRFEVEVFGNGEMKDVDTEVVNPFIEVNFNVFQDGSNMSDWPTFCIFFDDQILFNSLLNKIFGL